MQSGFVFEQDGLCLDFHIESEENRLFLALLLRDLGGFELKENRMILPEIEIDQLKWLDHWQARLSGSEAGATGLLSMELRLIDPYVSGVVRWLTALGYSTTSSCDGHGRVLPRFDLKNRVDQEDVSALILKMSRRRVVYAAPYLCPNRWQSRDEFYFDLLDLAEELRLEAPKVLDKISCKKKWGK